MSLVNKTTGQLNDKKNRVPQLFENRENCCGCSACFSICPVHAISMNPDEEGFLYPIVDAKKCIRCNKCISVCSFKVDQEDKKYMDFQWSTPLSFAVQNKNTEVRKASRSGGVFSALTDNILAESGVVYGCVLEGSLEAIHIRAEDISTRDMMRGSKYIQSDTQAVIHEVKEDLESGRKVLFSGTSCQIAGLKRFLRKEYENLICVDIVCHGVPSPLIWREYIRWQESKYRKKIVGVDFRNKNDFGWADHVESMWLSSGKQVDSRVFSSLFYSHCILRPCCYKCPYKSIIHPGDLTIADYWGIEKVAPQFNDNKGTSLVLINNDKGDKAFETVCSNLNYIRTKIEDSMQDPLKKPCAEPENRKQFWQDYETMSFDDFLKKYINNKISSIVKLRLKRWINHVRS